MVLNLKILIDFQNQIIEDSESQSTGIEYTSKLRIETNTTRLNIYYKKGESPYTEFTKWLSSNNYNPSVGNHFKVLQILDNENIINIDLKDSLITKTEMSSNFHENGLYYFCIHLSSFDLKKKNKYESKNKVSGYVHLTKNAIGLINDYYRIDKFLHDPNKFEAFNKEEDFTDFGEVKIKPSFLFKSIPDQFDTEIIQKSPKLIFECENISYDKFLDYVTVITTLLSLFSGFQIQSKFIQFKTQEFTHNRYNYFNNDSYKTQKSNTLRMDSFTGAMQILTYTGPGILEHKETLSDISYLHTMAKINNGLAEFMLNFSIIESLRNLLLGQEKITEKYQFDKTNREVNLIIKDKFKEIKNHIVEEIEKEIFEAKIGNHVKNIKLLPLKDQYLNFFLFLKINVANYDCNSPVKIKT
jgi:hypothetical protein